jgi:hypothetical protein
VDWQGKYVKLYSVNKKLVRDEKYKKNQKKYLISIFKLFAAEFIDENPEPRNPQVFVV